MENYNSTRVTLKISEGGDKANASLMAYVVDHHGSLIESAAFEKNTAVLKQTRGTMEGQQRIYIAQPLPKDLEKKINERLLVNAGAYSVVQNFIGNEIAISRVPTTLFDPWNLELCFIQGNITNNVLINGVEVTSPVNNARVHIERIGRRLRWPLWPIWYDRIPDWVIDETRNQLLQISPAPPIPEDVMQGIRSDSRDKVLQTLADNHEFFHPYFCRWAWCWPWFYYVIDETIVSTDCNGNFDWPEIFLSCCPPNIYIWVEVNIGGQWVTVYKPWLPCSTYWPYTCGAPININLGNLNLLPCNNNGALPGECVYLNSVSGGTPIRSIQQSNSSSGHLSNAVGLVDYTDGNGNDHGNISPFGSSFSFWLQFGVNLYGATFGGNTITNYRWSYVQKTDAYLQTPVSPVSGTLNPIVNMPYYYYLPNPSGVGYDEIIGTFNLGPFYDASNKPMYVIPQSSPTLSYPSLPAGAQISLPAGAVDPAWYYPYPLTVSISLDSGHYPDGLYEFTFELLNETGTVVPIPVTNNAPFLIDAIPTDINPGGATMINAYGLLSGGGISENYVITDGLGINAVGFQFQMRIDNAHCYAGISDAIVDGATTDTECGTGTYQEGTDPVELIFQAGHPHNFALFSFEVEKGNSGYVAAAGLAGESANANIPPAVVTLANNAAGTTFDISQVSSLPLLNPENPEFQVANMDEYSSTGITVGALLGTCTTAAFSENLSVTGTHTDGTGRVTAFDASVVAAIAISPAIVAPSPGS